MSLAEELPEGWTWSTVKDCFSEIRNGTTAKQNKRQRGGPVSRIETIQDARFDRSRLGHIEDPSPELLTTFRYKFGDIALSHINSYDHVGKTALYEGAPPLLIHGMNLLRLRLGHAYLIPKFVYLFMQSNCFREGVRDRVHRAVNQVSINQKNLSRVRVPLAPLREQRRIVTKVEELLARVNAAKKRLAKLPQILRRFRQSVLATACSGRFTEDWRDSRRAGAGSNGESELPAGWKRRPLTELCDRFQYGSSKKSQKMGEVPVLRMGNVQDGEIDWSDLVYSSDKREIEKYKLQPNSVLFNRTNSPELVGKTAIYRGGRPAIYAGYLIKIQHGEDLNPEYLNYCLNAPEFKEYCLRTRTDGVSQSNINAKKLAAYDMPWCNIAEQQEIVRQTKALFKLADTIEEHIAAATKRAEKLTQSILARAFRGELIPTEAELANREGRSYEPASELLGRIQAERSTDCGVRNKKARTKQTAQK